MAFDSLEDALEGSCYSPGARTQESVFQPLSPLPQAPLQRGNYFVAKSKNAQKPIVEQPAAAQESSAPRTWFDVRCEVTESASKAQRLKMAGHFEEAIRAYDEMIQLGALLVGSVLRAALQTTVVRARHMDQ